MPTNGKSVSSNKKKTVKKKDSTNKTKIVSKTSKDVSNDIADNRILFNNIANITSRVMDVENQTVDTGKYGTTIITSHDDGGKSSNLASPKANPAYKPDGKISNKSSNFSILNQDAVKDIYHSTNLFDRNEINAALYNKTFRFGLINPYGAISTAREYLFFTKPDLNIIDTNDNLVVGNSLQSGLGNIPFWIDLFNTRKNTTIKTLQSSLDKSDPFNHLLQNQVISNLDVPSLSAQMTDTPTNMFGVGFSYRGSSEGEDDNPEFSLEFKDTRYLDTYMFFKAYEEYETLKHHGIIRPSKYYIKNKIIHDEFSIYKFILDEDLETIIYYGKMYGVTPKSLPRDVFSNPNFDSGLSYSIDFRAAFYEDMKPDILADFNYISKDYYNKQPYQLSPYNSQLGHSDTRPAKAAFVYKVEDSNSPTGYVYKLKWRGSDQI